VPKGMTFARGEMAWTTFNKNMEIYEKKWSGNLIGKVDLQKEVLEKEIKNRGAIAKRQHPTQKSVELHTWIINDFFANCDVIFDGFGGSGTTLLACHQVNKKCLIIELIPQYCDVIIKRMLKLDPSLTIKRNGIICNKELFF
jgi:DNA modification methylase